jgi:hypothetical protein
VDFVHQFFVIAVPKKDKRSHNRHFADARDIRSAARTLRLAAVRGM